MKFSIIIPHKNTPILLERLLSTIPQREDLEILIIDDNSSDEIVNFEEFPGMRMNNVRCFFEKSNIGAGNARNIGVKHAKGEWLLFADSDDYFVPEIARVLNKYSNETNIDMVFLNAKTVNENGLLGNLSLNRYIQNAIKQKPCSLEVLKYEFWAPWSRMVKRSIFIENNIKFDNVPVGNDMIGILNASRFSKSFSIESPVVYHYYKPTEGSQTKNKYTTQTQIQRLENKFKANKLYSEVKYPFFWPLFIDFKPIIKTQQHLELKELKTKYNYSFYKDLINFIKYFLGKIFKII